MIGKLLRGIGSGIGVGLGLGVALGAGVAFRGGTLRPVLVGAAKGAIALREKALVVSTGMRENAEDLYHEALAERSIEVDAREGARERNGGALDLDDTIVIPRPR